MSGRGDDFFRISEKLAANARILRENWLRTPPKRKPTQRNADHEKTRENQNMGEKQHDEKVKAEHDVLTGPVWLRPGGQHEPDLRNIPDQFTMQDGTVVVPHDPVERPAHYTSHPSGIECIQITEHMSFCIGNAVKYLFRAGKKDGHSKYIQDLRKSVWYINREIERFEKCKTFNEWVQLCDK